MNVVGRVLVIASLVGLSSSLCLAQAPSNDPARAMRDFRVKFLSSSAASFGFKPTKEFPRVFGVVMDWPVGDNTATIVSALDGSASLYTTTTLGILGGAGHESVRAAARRFVAVAESHHDAGVPTASYPYPANGKIRFYLRTFRDVRVIETDAASAYSAPGPYSRLFRAGQSVLTELRKVVEAKR